MTGAVHDEGIEVRIHDLRLAARIGAHAHEMDRRQMLRVMVSLRLKLAPLDQLSATIDYEGVLVLAQALANEHIVLLETFCARLTSQFSPPDRSIKSRSSRYDVGVGGQIKSARSTKQIPKLHKSFDAVSLKIQERSMTTPLNQTFAFPYYAEPTLYVAVGDMLRPWEYNGWKSESLSWKQSCYIHTGLSGPVVCVDGPDADAFVAQLCTNNLATFPEGTMRHAVMCTEEGLIAAHGILQRYEDGHYRHFAGGPWGLYQGLKGKFNVRVWMEDSYLTQIAGPRSLEALQRATGEDLSDIKFLRYRKTQIAGKKVEVGRIGMSGNLAYEVRGPIADGPAVYDAIYQANKDIGIERLGWRTYLVNHVEGGFPQANWTFGMAVVNDRGFRDWVGQDHFVLHSQRTGSYDPADLRARQRNPFEVNWDKAVRFDHEFIGREALEKVAASPDQRRTVTLRWNADDVIDIYASLYRRGEEYRTMDLPTTPTWGHGMLEHADRLLAGDKLVGMSSGSIYSYYFRENLSMGCVDVRFSEPGTELIVQWGDYGKRIKEVRVTVDRFPYLDEKRNSVA